MKLHLETDSGVTVIENTFIDRYMPGANGEFVKLYLYLLRCAGAGRELSISSIADFFDHTEKDVRRALAYWEKLDVLKLQYDSRGGISDIVLTARETEEAEEDDAERTRESIGEGAMLSARETRRPGAESGRIIPISEALPPAELPDKHSLSPARKRELKGQEDIKQLVFVAETYLGRILTAQEANNLLYFYDTLGFDPDLIEYLLEYCASKGNPGARYMERVAQGWYQSGITTVAQAKREVSGYHRDYYQIFDALGIHGRAPAPKEIEYMQKWISEWDFDLDLIREACSRTILLTQKPSIQYADGILKSWHEEGIRSLEEIAARDQAHTARQSVPRRSAAQPRSDRAGRLGNFQQRSYNYDALEQQLYAAQAAKGE